jgi:uncharacterized protein involved in outer membrane biogenesis
VRESLTVLAGLLVLALLAALIGPHFVDWRLYRPQIEARLSTALGVETRVAGGIGLRLLPSPRLNLGEVRIGDQSGDTSAATAEQVTVELALTALARGDFRFSDAEIEGATLSLVADETGAIRLPNRSGAGLPAQTSLDRFSIRRSAVIWREADKEPVTVSPISAELTAVSLAGPWRIEGEAAGASLRLATGVIEPDGRMRAKATIIGEEAQLGFDGAFLLPGGADGIRPGLDGAFTVAPGGALSLAGQVKGDGRKLEIAGLSVDIAGGAAKLEGEGQYLPATGSGSLGLRARRVDADALIAALGERAGFARALRALPGTLDLGLELDQLVWRGEDFSAVALRGKLDAEGLERASASIKVAGALIEASGAANAAGLRGKANLKAEDARRLALVLARAGLDAALADAIANLGRVDAEMVGDWAPERLHLERFTVAGASGVRFDGTGEVAADRLGATLAVQGLDLNGLPPGESFAGLIGDRDLALDLSLNGARFRSAPPGSAKLALSRDGASWRLSRLAIDGFGGVSVTGAGALLHEGGEISGRIRAPRFETLAALVGPLLPEAVRQPLARVGDGLSRLDASYRLTRATAGDTAVAVEGMAQAGTLALNARLDQAGAWSAADLRFDLGDRRQAFAALGLPLPMQGGPGRLILESRPGQLKGSLAGRGLSIVLDGEGGADAPRLTLQADGPGQVLPEGTVRLLRDAVLDAHGRVSFAAEQTRFDDLVANLGGRSARGALSLAREGAVSGKLTLQRVDLRNLLGASLGAATAPANAVWSTARFGAMPGLGDLRLAVEAAALRVSDDVELANASFVLDAGATGIRIGNLSGAYGGGTVSGQFSAHREGGLAQVSGRVAVAGIDLATLTGNALAGRLTGQFEGGGSGESPARLVASLGGSGTLSLTGASLARFDPGGYARVIAATGEDASESESGRLQARLAEALGRGAWRLGDITLPFTLAGGIARLAPQVLERSDLRAETSGVVDLRALTADLRLGLRPLGPMPKGWSQAAPVLGVAWRGPLSALNRETDVGALSNAVAARALAREIERVEAFEADARERAMHARRLRAERETRENERKLADFLRAEEERRLAEEKRAEDERRAMEARALEETRRAQEALRLDEVRRAEEARKVEDTRRRAEAEARAAAARAVQTQTGPLILPGAPRENFPAPSPGLPALGPPIQIEPVPRPFSRGVQPN